MKKTTYKRSKKKFEAEVHLQEGDPNESILPTSSSKPKRGPVACFCIERHLLKTIDHSKHPTARGERLKELVFGTRKEVERYIREMEKANPEYTYYSVITFRDPDTLDKKILTKIKKEFHLKRTDI